MGFKLCIPFSIQDYRNPPAITPTIITGQTVPSYSLHFGMLTSQVITIPTGVVSVLDQHHPAFGILDTVTATYRMYASILEVNLSLFHFFISLMFARY